MERLWSPWRLAYVSGTSSPAACIFCEASVAGVQPDRDVLVLMRGDYSFVVLNLYPYNSGHLMIAPYRHVGSLAAATCDELHEMTRLTQDAEVALTEAYRPHGINGGINLGRPAGAGVVDHIHFHMLPRWNGDTSFMSVIGETRVLPESLIDSAAKLRPIFERLARARAPRASAR